MARRSTSVIRVQPSNNATRTHPSYLPGRQVKPRGPAGAKSSDTEQRDLHHAKHAMLRSNLSETAALRC